VPYEEIEKNEFNLNIPRYIDTQEAEDIQDLNAHLNGGIPNRDIEGLNAYWEVYPSMKKVLFEPLRDGYAKLKVDGTAVKETIYAHSEFIKYRRELGEFLMHGSEPLINHCWVLKKKHHQKNWCIN
jgi:type I restriction enzyme M protein